MFLGIVGFFPQQRREFAMKFDLNNPRTLSMTAIMTALVLALTRASIVPNGVGGYSHLGDVAILFTSFAFGPWAGMVAGGLGTALADVSTGAYAAFAPLSFVAHGLEGFAAGWIFSRRQDNVGLALGTLVGAIIVIGGYFLGEYFFPLWGGPATAFGELLPNTIQMAIGSLGGLVYLAVRRAYPQLRAEDGALS
jgi:uncharacterized membrane protein